MPLLRLLSLLPLLALTTDPPAGDPPVSDPPEGETPDPPADDGEELGEKGRAALKAEREARKKAERDAREVREELDRLKADARKRADEEAAEQGRFRELADQREAELTEVRASLTTIQAERDELLELVKGDVEATWADIPEEVRDLYEGDDDDILAKRRHLDRSAKLIARLTASDNRAPGHNRDPKGDTSTETPKIDVSRFARFG